jgi:hypothetical protein
VITRLLEGNKRFVAETFEKDRGFFAELAKSQRPTVLWIGCSDSRVAVNVITDTKPGEVFVHRNVGNVVAENDWNLSAVLEFSINHLQIPDVVKPSGAPQRAPRSVSRRYCARWRSASALLPMRSSRRDALRCASASAGSASMARA